MCDHAISRRAAIRKLAGFMTLPWIGSAASAANPGLRKLSTKLVSLTKPVNVFGKDDRTPLSSLKYPWRTVGKINSCTGTLVSKDLVLTAAHCVVNMDKTFKEGSNYFYPAYDGAIQRVARYSVKYVYYGTANAEEERENDWALLRLREPIGDQYGWLGTAEDYDQEHQFTVGAIGYSEDCREGKTAGYCPECQIRKKNSNGLWYHDCDSTRGASGGPLLFDKGAGTGKPDPRILALHVAEFRKGGKESLRLADYTDEYANVAVPASRFGPKLRELLDRN